ncbi:MAG: methionyl-tRNA formyltransferase [Candidatus Kapaibacterium sp.]
MSDLKIIFMGTPEFAVPSLEAIHNKYGIQQVVTVPDKHKGRGLRLQASPVKSKAIELGIPVLQPESLKDEIFLKEVQALKPDLIIVIAFRILPAELYKIPRIASFNIHGSLLPKYRGAAPINHAIINGERETGLTSFVLKDKVDTGEVLLTKKIGIGPDMTAGELHDIMMPLAAELTIETINLLSDGHYKTSSQNDVLATNAPKLTKNNTKIDWNQNSEKIFNFIRGLSPYPCAWTVMSNEPIKLLKVKILASNSLEASQYIVSKNGFIVGTATNDIEIVELKPNNKQRMSSSDFINGFRGQTTGYLI